MTCAGEILDRVKQHYGLHTNTELAEFLEETPQNISNWYSRGTLNYQKVIEKCKGVDLNWLLRGKALRTYRPRIGYSSPTDTCSGMAADVEAPYAAAQPSEKSGQPE